MARSTKTLRSLLLLTVIILTTFAAVVYGVFQFRTDAFTTRLKEKQPMSILIIVSNDDRLEFLNLFLYHPGTKKGSLFFIPGNLGSRIESLNRYDKIDLLYEAGDLSSLRKELEQIVGFPTSFYLDISLRNIRKLVDMLGGLELFISNPVDIVDGTRRVLLPSGSVLLDGEKVIDL